MVTTTLQRTCSNCREIKPLNKNYFYGSNIKNNGFQYNCIICEKKRLKSRGTRTKLEPINAFFIPLKKGEMDFQEKALCKGMSPEFFDRENTHLIESHCNFCPVIQDCLDFMLEKTEGFTGIAGGKVFTAGRISSTQKVCSRCNEKKYVNDFYKKGSSVRAECKSCYTQYYRNKKNKRNGEA